jgi:hypothetical protein
MSIYRIDRYSHIYSPHCHPWKVAIRRWVCWRAMRVHRSDGMSAGLGGNQNNGFGMCIQRLAEPSSTVCRLLPSNFHRAMSVSMTSIIVYFN